LTAAEVAPLGPFGNVNPPLRSSDDRAAVQEALAQGVIDVIATDHAPHEVAAKAAGANGYHGFETALAVVLGLDLDPKVLYRACVERPRRIIGQSIEDEWILIDPDREWTVDPDAFKSRGRNTPFEGRRLRGRIVMTVCRGQIIVERMLQRV
jgi:dihydroorotase